VDVNSVFSLEHSVAVVVGTSPNIGAGIALRLAVAGAHVACIDRDEAVADCAAHEIRRTGGRAIAVKCDVTSEQEVARAVDQINTEAGLADILVNGAVRYIEKGIRSMSLEEWRAQLAILLDGPFLFTKYVADALIGAGRAGSIINLISTAGHQGEPGNIGYTTAKGGLLNMTRSLAMELAPYGIRVNSLTPTATDPREGIERRRRWGMAGVPDQAVVTLKAAAAQAPLGTLPSPSDYGNAAVFLASPAARMITGADLRVDAGCVAKYWRDKSTLPASG
jgi:NAD(P)-dependent dehydrogenase (short-subunit alcohol dehydrogenase family)